MAEPTATYRAGPPGQGASTAAAARPVMDDPVPLGLIAFAIAAFTSGTVMAGWWPYGTAAMVVIAPLLLIIGGIAQFVVAMWCYARHRALAATFFGAFGSLFAVVALYGMTAPVAGRPAMSVLLGPLAVGVGCFAFVALLLALALAPTNMAFSLTSFTLFLSLFFITWSLFAEANTLLGAIGGWIGVIAGFFGFLTAAGVTMGQEMAAPRGLPGMRRARPARPQPTT
jgi:succinate-acetate transporter protein